MKKLIRDEKGQVLIMALILLLISGLIAAPLLSYMNTGLTVGGVYEKKTDELYAADAGVEDAIWRIQNNKVEFDEDGYYSYPDPEEGVAELWLINEKSVHVEIYREDLDPTCGENLTYQILSIATSDAGTSTTIDAYLSVQYVDFSALLDNAIVSNTSIIIDNGVDVTGNVTSGGSVTIRGDGSDEDVDGTVTENAELDWPSWEALSAYYLNQVKDGMTYYGNTILDLEGNSCPSGPIYKTIDKITERVNWPDGLGPLKVDGKLDIISSDNDEVVTLKLNETIYITGDTKIYGPNAKKPYGLTIDLNGQTIFVESDTAGGKYALEIKDCVIVGSGCIIAVGDVYFAPKGDVGGEDDFVLVMSIEGTTILQPSGTFYGCMAGNLCVDVSSGLNATIINSGLAEGQSLDFPMGVGGADETPIVTGLSIASWEVVGRQ